MTDELQDVYHGDLVQDTNGYFVINDVTRVITVGIDRNVTLGQFDHNSQRFTFKISRYVDGHDMSECTKVEIHYINIGVGSTERNKGLYEVTDLRVDPDDPDYVLCSWLVSQNATKLAGTLNFLVHYACMDGDIVEYSWHSGIYKGIKVGDGINNTAEIIEQYVDVLEEWKLDLVNTGTISVTNINSARDAALSDITGVKEQVETARDEAIERINKTATTKIDDARDSAIQEIDNAKTEYADTHNESLAAIGKAKEEAVSEVLAVSTHIDEDGTWVVGGQDTGVPALGKSAYKYAQEGGYQGTEEDFTNKLSGIVDYTGIHIGPDAPQRGEEMWLDTDEEVSAEEGGMSAIFDGTAEVGQLLIVKEIDALGKPTKLETAKDLPYVDASGVIHKLPNKFIDADWMATSVEHIDSSVIIPEQNVSSGIWRNRQMDIQPGITYDVHINGVVYPCVAFNEDGICIGNNPSLTRNDLPFCIFWAGGSAAAGFFYNNRDVLSGTIYMKVTGHSWTEYNKLPEEFLPEEVLITGITEITVEEA